MAELREARRTIAELRRELEQRDELAYFDDGEFTVFLDDEHSSMLQTLFDGQLLVADQDATHELEDALSEFVSNWLDVQWNTLYPDRGGPTRRLAASPSAHSKAQEGIAFPHYITTHRT